MNAMGIIFTNDANIGELTAKRSIASIPFGGRYRQVDFALFLSRDLPAVYIIDSEGKLFQARKTIETFPFNTIHTSERN